MPFGVVTCFRGCHIRQPFSKYLYTKYVCMHVYHRICLDFKYGLRSLGSFIRSQSIQKENKRTLRTNKV